MAMIRPETEMKDSGIEWIGDIPANWGKSKLKYLGVYINGYAFKPSDWSARGRQIIRIQDLTGSNSGEPNYFDGTLDEKYRVVNGDILVSWAATLDAFVWTKEDGWLNQHIFKAVPNEKIVKGYFLWLLKVAMDNMNNDDKHGIVMQHVTIGLFNNYVVPLAPYTEQQAIADYLDETFSKIDEIIAEAKASIAEYKELKQSVIFKAVTKGLNKNVAMKDSGYDFIGCIPSEWEMCKVRHLGTAQNGISIGGDAFGSGHPFVSYGDVYKNYSLPKTVDKLVQSSEEDRKRYSVEKGDWFFTRTSETIEEVGFSCVCEETIPDAVFAGFLIRVRPFNNRIYTGFAKYYFRSNHLRTFFVKEMNLVTRASLAQGLLKDAPVVVPPYDEQIEIANYLENKCEIIDGVIKDKESTINDLEAYKKSLIYEVVTGKRRVV